MIRERRNNKNNKQERRFGRFFYNIALVIFAFIAILTIFTGIYSGFTNERITIILMNLWFMLFTMDVITIRFRRQGEHARWHDWVLFSRTNKDDNLNTSHKTSCHNIEFKKTGS